MQGKVGDLSFSKSRTRRYEVRTPGGADKQRIMTDPNFQRTRENMAEFGSAAAVAKLIHTQLTNLLLCLGDTMLSNRSTFIVLRFRNNDTRLKNEQYGNINNNIVVVLIRKENLYNVF